MSLGCSGDAALKTPLLAKLTADHAKLLELAGRLKGFCATATPLTRMLALKTAAELSNLARTHHALEEAQLFPLLGRTGGPSEPVHLLEEHRAAEGALNDILVTLRRNAPAGPSADAIAANLCEHVEHESAIFARLDAVLAAK